MGENYPEGKYMSTVKIGPKGQIVIPKEVREMFGFEVGDNILLLADKNQGVALQPFSYAEAFWNAVSQVKGEKK